MKQLKSSVEDLREIFEKNIAVRHIAEPFCSFDEVADAQKVRDFMNGPEDYDVVGVRQRGLVTGYVHRTALVQGKIGDHLKKFESHELLPGTAPLLEALKVLADSGRVFVLSFGKVSGIITRGDLQKVLVRMWLFGLISLIEMQLLRIIRDRFPYDLSELLTTGRIKKAKKLLEMRKKRNEAIDLADCLQFCDKREIVVKTKELHEKLGFSETALETLLKELEKLRNNLAHAQDVITGNWPGIVDLASSAETFLKKCEGVGNVSNVAA